MKDKTVDKEEKCTCNETQECNCGETCNCGDSCTCGEECSCNDNKECSCDDESKHNSKKDKHNKNKDRDKLIEACNLIKELQDGLARNKAELVNYRKRKDDEVAKQLLYCNEDIVKELLPIIDNFERAIKLDDDNLDDALSKFLAGFKMIYCNMVSILEKYGVKAIDGSNKPFDPKYHQAVLMEHRDDVEPGNVLEVLQKGYLLKDKIIRPAMVRVSE